MYLIITSIPDRPLKNYEWLIYKYPLSHINLFVGYIDVSIILSYISIYYIIINNYYYFNSRVL